MTPARTVANGVRIPSLCQLLLTALLRLFVELVLGIAATLGMRLCRLARDWHTNQIPEALPQATHDTSHKEPTTPTGFILGLEPRISVGPTRGLAEPPREAKPGPPGSRPALAAKQRSLLAPRKPHTSRESFPGKPKAHPGNPSCQSRGDHPPIPPPCEPRFSGQARE